MSVFSLEAIEAIVGAGAVLTGEDASPYLTDWRGAFRGSALAVVRPSSTHTVADVVRYCAQTGTPVVPQGGNTGLAAGATPAGVHNGIVLSLSRMRTVRSLDAAGNTIAVDAGCVLAEIQSAAADAQRYFPLSLGAEGSAQIGGLISTNAGGSGVLRYGTMRALVLGLEVVLPDGRIADGMRALRKDNAGYDWKQLFIGSEGTLGIITGAVLRLFPGLSQKTTALLGLKAPDDAIAAFAYLQNNLGDTLTACELFSDRSVALRLAHEPMLDFPMKRQAWYLLIEAASSLSALEDAAERAFGDLLEKALAGDCIVATTAKQADALWEWRESIPETEKRTGRSAKHDVSVPISQIGAFVAEATAAVEGAFPGANVLAFGHIGDGNVHFNVLLPPEGVTPEAVNAVVHGIVRTYRGSITAEHGIGRYRRAELCEHRSPVEMDLMRQIKRAVDPDNLMNPGAVL